MANVSEEAYKEFVATLNIADIKSFLHICDDDVYVAANHTVQSFLKEIDGRWRETVKLGDKLGERYIFVINRSTLEHCTYFDVGLKELVPTAAAATAATADAASMTADILAQPLIVFMETPLLYGPYQMNSEEKPQFKSCKVLSKYYDLF